MPTFIICNIFQVWWGLLCNILCRPNKCWTSLKWWWTRSIIANWYLKSNYTFYLFENAYMYKPKFMKFLKHFPFKWNYLTLDLYTTHVVKDAQIKSSIVGFPYHQFLVAKSTIENKNPYLVTKGAIFIGFKPHIICK